MNVSRMLLDLLIAIVLVIVALPLGTLPLDTASAEEPAPAAPRLQGNSALRQLIAEKLAEEDGEATPDVKAEEPSAEDGKVDPFTVPQTDSVPELMTFLDSMINFRPKSREELVRSRVRLSGALKDAAEQIVAKATDDEKKLPGYKDAEAVVLNFRAQDRELNDEQEGKLLDELKAYFTANAEPSTYAIRAAQILASKHEYGGEPERAAAIYREIGPILAKSSDEKLARSGVMMEGAARRMTLVGQPIEVTGTEMDGEKFDIKDLRGKVVLVDFWATWCGPCLGELPNVRRNYELYHDKGFEVVGISLDRDRQALEKFLVDEQTPWITLYDGDWKDNSVATHYGVMGIPTVILVDKEGKVVSTRARGEELVRLLAEQLGPPPEQPAEPAEEKPAEDKPAGDAEKPAGAAATE